MDNEKIYKTYPYLDFGIVFFEELIYFRST